MAKSLLVATSMCVISACTQENQLRFVASSPSKHHELVIELPQYGFPNQAPKALWIGAWSEIGNRPVIYWQVLGRSITSFWVGWPKEGKHFTILVCSSSGFSSIERLSLADATERGAISPDFSESDTDLFRSLRASFGDESGVQKAKSNSDLIDWFCNGDGEAAFKNKYIRHPSNYGKMGNVIRIP